MKGPTTAGQKYGSFLPKVTTGDESWDYGYGNIQELSQIFKLNDKLCWTASLNRNFRDVFCSESGTVSVVQGAAERTPRFWRGIASGGERVQW